MRPFQDAAFRRSVAIDPAQPQQALARLGALTHDVAAALMANERVGMQRIAIDGDPPAPVTRPTCHPVHAALGYEHRWRSLRLGVDAMVILDRTRHTDYRAAGERVQVRRGTTTSLAIAPRVRISVLASARVEVFAAFATELWLRRAVYRLAAPFWVRATPSTGLAIRI